MNQASIINYGISEHLKSDFDMLRETTYYINIENVSTSSSGETKHKFLNKNVDKLAQHLVCRHYGNICYELAHLCWAIVHTSKVPDQAIVQYFWLNTVCTQSQFKTHFLAQLHEGQGVQNTPINNCQISMLSEHLNIAIHQHTFSINAARANFLSCFMEWLACAIPETISYIFHALIGKGHNGISELASTLQSDIYQYLSEHLPPAKLQQRFRLLESYHKGTDVCDSTIMQFYCTHNHLEGCGKFSNVVNDTFSFMLALKQTNEAKMLDYAASYESFFSAESVDGSALDETQHAEQIFSIVQHQEASLLYELETLSSLPKVFSKAQFDALYMLVEYRQFFPDFSLTWLRCQIFGKWQNKLIQAHRNKTVENIHECEPDEGYSDAQQKLLLSLASSYQAQMAMIHIVLSAATNSPSSQAYVDLLSILHALCKDHPSLKAHVKIINTCVNEVNTEHSTQLDEAYKTLARSDSFLDIRQSAVQAFKAINRAGFTSSSALRLEEYVNANHDLTSIQNTLRQVLSHLVSKKLCEESNFNADRFIFVKEFTRLYLKDSN